MPIVTGLTKLPPARAALLVLIGACGPHAVAPAPAAPGTGRLTPEALDQIGAVGESACQGHNAPEPRSASGCALLGPYPGELQGPAIGAPIETLAEAVSACDALPDCAGVRTNWYMGAPWVTVSGASRFAADPSSYGCTIVLDCRTR